uniref:Encystation-mediating serine proteinase n=1 Tax=Acanthamoeba healyi TaxID=65661 RepID=B0FYM4_9EUKA|nr:encystation-mediating serine proteinase [Acanthamoeba healyi]
MKGTLRTTLALLALLSVFASAELAPLHVAEAGKAIEGEYIVLLKPEVVHAEWESYVSDVGSLFATEVDGEILNTWTIGNTFKAIHVKTSAYTIQFLRTHPAVELIEENQVRTLQACSSESNAIWNLQRINAHPISDMNGKYSYGQTASDVDAYVIDTGILTTHQEFAGGRAIWGANFAGDNKNTDCNGHGTHVAGTVGGRTVGVARGVTLIAVKVLGCNGSGSSAGVISGIQWTAENARKRGRRSVANMSLGGGYSASENRAVAAVVDAGVPFAVAAGNEDQNACNTSPASEPKAITVGATYYTGNYVQDIRASFSNWGSCVDILAPGQSIKSAWIGSNNAYNTISGTSMASPHVCGVAALILGANPSYSAAQVKSKILADSTPNAIELRCTKTGCSSTPNKLLYTARC